MTVFASVLVLEEIGISEISNGSQLFTVTKYIQLFAFSCARFYYDTKLCGSFTCRDQIRLWHFDVLRVQNFRRLLSVYDHASWGP